MNAEQELKLLRHIANIDTTLAARNINSASQVREILTHLSRINDTLDSIEQNLTLLDTNK